MSTPDILNILFTSSFTILGGIIVFVVGQVVSKFIIEPFYEQSKLIGEIASSIIYYANAGAGVEPYYLQQIQNIKTRDDIDETAKELLIERYGNLMKNEWARSDETKMFLRQQASQLMGKTNAIPFYNFWVILSLWRLPTRKAIFEAAQELIGYSNDITKSMDRGRNIAKKLRIKIVLEKFGKG